MPRAAATRGTCTRASATVMSGSSPLPDVDHHVDRHLSELQAGIGGDVGLDRG